MSALPRGEDFGKTVQQADASMEDGLDASPDSVDLEPAIKVSFNDEVRLRRRLSAARQRLLHRQPDAAMMFIAEAQAIVQKIRESHQPEDRASWKHQFLCDQVQASQDVQQYLTGFWDQVYRSSQKLGGGQQVKVGETYVSINGSAWIAFNPELTDVQSSVLFPVANADDTTAALWLGTNQGLFAATVADNTK